MGANHFKVVESKASFYTNEWRNTIDLFNLSYLSRDRVTIDEIPFELGFQPEVNEEFPTIVNGKPRIEHNIHQIWISPNETKNVSRNDVLVPADFADNMRSFVEHNPSWTYYFWTYHAARRLIADRHPYLLDFFYNMTEPVVKADLVRYVVLYEYGGLYADLDTKNLRPLDIVTVKYPCILVLAPFENAVCMSKAPYQICNGEIFCRSKHPFFAQILKDISRKRFNPQAVFFIGPGYITAQFKTYMHIDRNDVRRVDLGQNSSSPYFFKGSISPNHIDGIYIPNTRFFLDQPHPILRAGVERRCSDVTLQEQDALVKRMCAVVKKRGFLRNPGKFTFLTHEYAFSFGQARRNAGFTYINLKSVVANFVYYADKDVSDTGDRNVLSLK